MTAEVEVTRADHEMAEPFISAFGRANAHEALAEAFARHRIASTIPKDEAIDELVGALRFYAAEYNWRSSSLYMCGHSGETNATADRGNKAREALAKHGGKP